jgi:hypothetical protein
VPIGEAAVLARRWPALESVEIARGTFGGFEVSGASIWLASGTSTARAGRMTKRSRVSSDTTFFERYGDWFYLLVMCVSILGSAAATLVSRAANRCQDLVGLALEVGQFQFVLDVAARPHDGEELAQERIPARRPITRARSRASSSATATGSTSW